MPVETTGRVCSARSKPLKLFGHTFKSITFIQMAGQMPELAGKCPVIDCYYEQCQWCAYMCV